MHPQPCGSFKSGFELIPKNGWIQPWNASTVDTGNGNFILAKSSHAKSLGCSVVYDVKTRRPSHYVVTDLYNNDEKEAIAAALLEKRNSLRFN